MIVGLVAGLVLQLIGIYGDSAAPRFVGAALPLVALGLGVAVDRRRRRSRDD